MIANCHPVQSERIELAGLAAGRAKRVPESGGQIDGTQSVEEDTHLDAALLCPHQRFQKLRAECSWLVDIHFEPNGFARSVDGLEQGRKDFPTSK